MIFSGVYDLLPGFELEATIKTTVVTESDMKKFIVKPTLERIQTEK